MSIHLYGFCQSIYDIYINDHTIMEMGIIDSNNSSTVYVILYEFIDTYFLDSNRRVGVWWCVSSWWPLFPSRSYVLMNIYIYIYIYLYMLFYMTSVFFGFSDDSLIPECLWLKVFVLNNTLIIGIRCSTIPHLPGCFCPWTLFQNIGFSEVPSDSFMSHLDTQIGYSAGVWQALQLIFLATFDVVD